MFFTKISCIFVIFLHFISNKYVLVNGANILGLMGITSPSHHIWNSVLLHRLAELGHNVTVLSVDLPDSNEKLPSNLHYIYLEKGYSMYENELELDIRSYIGVKSFKSIPMLYDFGWKTLIGITQSEGLQKLLNYPDDFKFDLVIQDYTLGPTLLGFLHKFGYPPLIGLSAFLNPPNTIDSMSNHYFPAYVPYHCTGYDSEMNFWQRLENTLIFIADTSYRRLIYLPKIDSIIRPYFSKDMPPLADLEKLTKISMVNSHPVIGYVEPVPQNVIEIGGMQILDPKPLPTDFQVFLNKSNNGVIVVSFGTNMLSSDFKSEELNVIIEAMRQLPQYDFVWKFDSKFLKEELPQNIFARSFLPQSDLLAHPKVKAFVTHCGALSTHESIWRGVPMIGVPLYFDQHRNIRKSILSGVAIELDFETMTMERLKDTIQAVVEDKKMAARAKKLSTDFRDRPMKPLDTAVWWTEYILRNPNPTHLISPAAKLNIFQANSLDILLTLWTFLVILICVIVILFLKTLKYLSNSSSSIKQKIN